MPALWPTITWSLLALGGVVAALAVLADPARGRLRCPGGWRRVLWVVPWRAGCWYDMRGVGEAEKNAAKVSAAAESESRVAHPSPLPSPHSGGLERGEGGACPECGRVWSKRSDLLRRRVRWRGVVLGVVVALLAWPASLGPRVQRYGGWSVCPTWALVMFAPVDEFCKGALGCPYSWPTMPEPMRELMFPKWERRYAAWETAWLKERLEAGVERVRGPFVGRDAVFVETEKYGSEEWWGWEGREFEEEERQQLVSAIVSNPIQVVRLESGAEPGVDRPMVPGPNSVRLSPSGLAILAVGGRGREVWLNALAAYDQRSPGSYLISSGATAPDGRTIEARVYDVSDIFPVLVPNDRPLVSEGGIAEGTPRAPLNRSMLARCVIAPMGSSSYIPRLLDPSENEWAIVIPYGVSPIFRHTPDAHERVQVALDAFRSVLHEPGKLSERLATGTPGHKMVLVNGAPLIDPAEFLLPSRNGERGVSISMSVIDAVLGREGGDESIGMTNVGHIFVVMGEEEKVSRAVAELELRRQRAIERARGERP